MHRSFVRPVGTTGRHQTSWPCGRKRERLGADDQIRRAELVRERPFVGIRELQRRRQVGGIAERRAAVDPARNRLDLGLAEPEVVLQLLDADVAVVPIGRHLASDAPSA